jgi:REP element-mobilizing transposase RayT
MANTYTQIYIQVVFAVAGRECLISKEHKEEIHRFITGIVTNDGQKLIAINSMPDHIHILIGLKPDMALSDLIRDIKANSARFINGKRWLNGRFYWQEGFGAFSYSHSQLPDVIGYIRNQENHHSKKSFRDEYISLLKRFDIGFDDRYVFESVDS